MGLDNQESYHICRLPGGRRKGDRLYYYKGNFYYPLELCGGQNGIVKRAIREFTKANREMVERDRAAQGYKTIIELFDDQMPK